MKVAKRQKGHTVHVRLRVRIAGSAVHVRVMAGTRLMGATAKRRAPAAMLSLRVPVNRRGRAALRHAHKLQLTVRVTVTPPGGAPLTATRRVTLRR